jgi:predicted DCC family thiol-disulfide oxidoreductase YuxK
MANSYTMERRYDPLMERVDCTLLFDGQCPLCRKEVAWLSRFNRRGRLGFEDISTAAFDPARYGLTRERVVAVIHAVLPDGRVVSRMEAFRHAYRTVGLGWLLAPTGWWLLRPLFDWLYERFAANRLRLGRLFGRRCEDDRCGTGAAR